MLWVEILLGIFEVLLLVFLVYRYHKEEKDMVMLCVTLIIYGRRTLSTIPAKLRDAVREELTAIGLDENGKPLPVKDNE